MTVIHITDRTSEKTTRETFLGGTLSVISHSGLHAAEKLLIERLAHLPTPPASLLVAGNRTGAIALAAHARFSGCALTCHVFDLHHARAIIRNLAANGLPPAFLRDAFATPPPDLAATKDVQESGAERQGSGGGAQGSAGEGQDVERSARVACTSQIPPAVYEAAFFMATPGSMTGELILDQIEDIHRNLADGAPCVIACEAESAPLLKQLRTLFGNVSVSHDRGGLVCATAVKREPLAKPRDFSATFPASLPGDKAPLRLCSLPGVFCHRRPDTGGLALAEVAARMLKPKMRVLDMGCGCGLVGLLLARHRPGVRVTFVDSHARALDATRRNLDALGIEGCDLVLSNTGTTQTGFDLFVGNPPYYSDFRIAQIFIDTALATLKPGGTCLLVAKSTDRLAADARAAFGNAEIQPRRGYGVVSSVRS